MWAGVDEGQRCAVFIIRSATISDKQWGYYMDVSARIAKARPGLFACIPEPGCGVPNAGWRSRFSEAGATFHPRTSFVLVTGSAIGRGVFTAMNWIRPFPFQAAVVEAWPEALAAFEGFGADATQVATMDRLFRETAHVPFA